MNRFFAENRLNDYIDGTISDEDKKIVEEALQNDPSLKEEYESILEAVQMLQNLDSESLAHLGDPHAYAPTRDLSNEIMDQVYKEPTPKVIHVNFKRNASLFFLAAAAILIVSISLPDKNATHTQTASVLHTLPKANSMQLPQNLNNQLTTLPIPIEELAVADAEEPEATPPPQKKKRTPRRVVQKNTIQPLVPDHAASYEENLYNLFISDPDILYKIEQLATDNNAQIAQRDGAPFEPYAMSDGRPSQVVKIKTNDIVIDQIEEKLRQFGTDFRTVSSEKSGSPIEILVNIHFE